MYLIIICIVYTRFAKICNFLFDTKYLMLKVWGVCDTHMQAKKHEDCFVLFYDC